MRVRNTLVALVFAVAGVAGVTLGGPAVARTTPECNSAWFVNDDETDRKPENTTAGMKFEPADLIHHNVSGLTTHDLEHGTFTAVPLPDQDSFFSVEVINTNGTGYATLRWNTATSKWDMVTGGELYSDADPTALVDSKSKSHRVVRFGVGYTKNPPGTVTTIVSEVNFNGQKYDLTCKPATPTKTASASTSVKPSTSASVKPSSSARPTTKPSARQSPIVGGGGHSGSPTLPVTGPGVAVAGVVVLLLGGGLYVMGRRRKTKFTA